MNTDESHGHKLLFPKEAFFNTIFLEEFAARTKGASINETECPWQKGRPGAIIRSAAVALHAYAGFS